MIQGKQDEVDFSLSKGIKPGASHARTVRFSETVDENGKQVYDYMLDRNPFNNFKRSVDSAVNFNASLTYVGKDKSKLNAALNKDVASGKLTERQAARMAYFADNVIEATNGNFNPIKSPTLRMLTKFASTYGVLSWGPTFVFSSLAEPANAAAGLQTLDSSFYNDLKKVGVDGAKGVAADFRKSKAETDKNWAEVYSVEPRKPLFQQALHEKLDSLGFKSPEATQATVTGVKEDPDTWQQRLTSQVFKRSGLNTLTEFTRMARMSTFDDFLWDGIRKLSTFKEGDVWLPKHQQAYDELITMGIDVDPLVKLVQSGELSISQLDKLPADSPIAKFLDDQYATGLANWTNYSIPNPGAANRPAIYLNPHLRAFTLFQGFASTFTAIHIPRLYKRATSQGALYSLNAFQQMATLAVLSFLAQELKDQFLAIGSGEVEPEDIGAQKKAYRAIKKTGLLGTPERILEYFFPLYEDNTKGFKGIAKDITSEAGPLGSIAWNSYKGVSSFAQGDAAAGTNSLLRLIPGLSLSTPARHKLTRYLTGDDEFGKYE